MDTRLLTAEDLLGLDGDFELVRGTLVEVTPPDWRHGALCARVAARLLNSGPGGLVATNDSGCILRREPDTVRGPDVAWLRPGRTPPEQGYLEGAPDLAVEIVSPGDRPGTIHAKIADYLEGGCPLVWVIDPRHSTVAVYTPDAPPQVLPCGDTLTGGGVLPGFEWPVSDLFA